MLRVASLGPSVCQGTLWALGLFLVVLPKLPHTYSFLTTGSQGFPDSELLCSICSEPPTYEHVSQQGTLQAGPRLKS